MQKADETGLRRVMSRAWQDTFSVMSNFAQKNMALVAMAASLQLITTRVTSNEFGRVWRITNKGLRWLNEENT